MIVPTTWDNLSDFVRWYIDNNYPMRVPENVRIYPTDVSYSCCVFRQDVYQVELYLAKPNFTSTKHSHPFEQQIIFLGGHMGGSRQSEENLEDNNCPQVWYGNRPTFDMNNEEPSKDFGKVGSILPENYWHEISAGAQGFVFFNCQRWNSRYDMDSAVVSYNGNSLGEIHDQIIRGRQVSIT